MVNRFEKSKADAQRKGALVQRQKKRNIKKDKASKFEKNQFVDKTKKNKK